MHEEIRENRCSRQVSVEPNVIESVHLADDLLYSNVGMSQQGK